MSSRNPFYTKYSLSLYRNGELVGVVNEDRQDFSLIAKDPNVAPLDADPNEIAIVNGQLSIWQDTGGGVFDWVSLTGAGSHTHPATSIIEDTDHNFVTGLQITDWDSKASSTDITTAVSTHETTYDHSLIHTQIANARTLYVDKNGNDTTGNGTIGNPFQTITAAVTKAITMSPAQNTQVAIIVGPGFYDEHVIIEKDGISLYGFGQNVTQIQRAGTCLTHRHNGTDYPWDAKVVGISFNSTNSEYSVRIEGVAGSSIAGDEIQYRDCRIAGTNSFYAEIANYIDFQNTFVMGAVNIINCAGVWVEQCEWAGSVTIDYNPAGDHPSDTGNYGLNWMNSIIRNTPTFLNNGKVGEDYQQLSVPTVQSMIDVWDNGTTRPSSPTTGTRFFDTTLGLPIWYNGSNWIDAAGNIV